MIKGYYHFLLESVLFTSGYFEEILNGIDDNISKDFLALVNKDIKTQYNAIDISDTNDRLSFVSDNQFQNKIKSGINPLDLFSDKNNKTYISRIFRQILKDNGKEYSDAEITKFVEKFKAAYNTYKTKKEKKDPIRSVTGEDIRYWYLVDNYYSKSIGGYGTLGNSCMKYSKCQTYFDIYTENPGVCQLIILTEFEEGVEKLRARAILWQTDRGPYLDRVYYTDPSEEEMLINWAKENKNCELYFKKYNGNLSVKLESKKEMYDKYPYMDSMTYYYITGRKLYNHEPNVPDDELILCQDTGGGFERQNLIYCECQDESYPEEDVVWSEYQNSYLHVDRSCWSEYYQSTLYDEDSVRSETLDDYMPREESVEVYINLEGEQDWFPKTHDLIARDSYDDDWYLKSMMKKIGDDWYIMEHVMVVYGIKNEDISKYKEIFSIDDNVDSSECVASKTILTLYKLRTNDSNENMSLDVYYNKVYMNVNYSQMLKSLEDMEDSEDAIDELESANSKLNGSINFYSNNNIIMDAGGLDKAIEIFNEYLDKMGRDDIIIFDKSFALAEKYNSIHEFPDLLKSTIKKIIKTYLIEFCKGVDNYNSVSRTFDKEKLSKFIKAFKAIFPENSTDSEIEYYLNMTCATLDYCFRLVLYYNSNNDSNIVKSLRYFTLFTNKLPNK